MVINSLTAACVSLSNVGVSHSFTAFKIFGAIFIIRIFLYLNNNFKELFNAVIPVFSVRRGGH
ncbi:hypothetical protein D3C87_2055950 [compost metagenome]